MAEKTLRFAVGSQEAGTRAALWELWNSDGRPDVYLACSGMTREFHASMHGSRQWHIALSKRLHSDGFDDPEVKPSSRYTDSWERPEEIAPGVTLAFRILVPWFSPTPCRKQDPAGLVLIQTPPQGLAVQFLVALVSSDFLPDSLLAQLPAGCQSLAQLRLSETEQLCLLSVTHPFVMPTFPSRTHAFFKGADERLLTSPTARSVVFGDAPDGSRVMLDVPASAVA